jgi:hypothetical protein
MSRECGFKEHDLDYTAKSIGSAASISEIKCRRCGIRMTVTLRSSGRTVRPDVDIYPATDTTTISRDMIGYFYAAYGPTLDELKQAGYQIAENTPTIHGTPVGVGLGLELPPRRRSHAGVVVAFLVAVAIFGVLVAVFASHHHAVTAASASAATGPASAVAGSASASASATAVKSATAQPPVEELTAIAEQDKTTVQGLAEHYWVPVLSSKKVGTVDPRDAEFPNRSYTNRMILENFNYWRSRYSSALLLRSSSYSSLVPGYWVIILNQPHSAPGDVISWCKAQGLNDDNCDATLLSNQLPNGPQTYQSW